MIVRDAAQPAARCLVAHGSPKKRRLIDQAAFIVSNRSVGGLETRLKLSVDELGILVGQHAWSFVVIVAGKETRVADQHAATRV